jgi:hypothetical protein
MAEKKVIELEIKTESVGSLKQQLREAQAAVSELSEKFGATSKEAINAAKRAAELKDAIADAKALTDAFNPDAKFNALSASIGGLLNGFQAFEGAMALVGVESEELQETLLKVQAAMALSQGLQGLLEARDSFKQLGAVAREALKGIRTGIAATGIGVFVVALGTIVAYWDDIKAAISGVSAEQDALNAKSEKDVELQKQKLDSLGSQDNILKLQGLSEKQILQLKLKQTEQAIKAYEVSIENQEATLKAQIEAEKRNKEILKGILSFMSAPLSLLLKTIDGIGAVLGKDWNLQEQLVDWEASFIFDPDEVKNEGLKAIQESKKVLAELKNQQAGFQLEIQNIEKEAAQKRKDAAKEQRDREKELAEERLKELEKAKEFEVTEEIEDAFRQMLVDSEAEKDAIREAAIAKQQEDELALMQFKGDVYKQDVENALAAEEQKKEITKRNTDFAIKSAQDSLSIVQELASQTQAKYESLNKAVLNNDKLTDKEKQKLLDENNARAKKAFDIQKKVSIASALVSTYQSAVSAYQSQFLPIPDPTSPIRGAIAAGLAVAAGLANVKNIASQQFEGASLSSSSGGGGGSSASGGVGGSVVSPSFNIVGNAQATSPLAGLGNQPLQAYVVSGEVTTAQSLDRNRINYATFG